MIKERNSERIMIENDFKRKTIDIEKEKLEKL